MTQVQISREKLALEEEIARGYKKLISLKDEMDNECIRNEKRKQNYKLLINNAELYFYLKRIERQQELEMQRKYAKYLKMHQNLPVIVQQ